MFSPINATVFLHKGLLVKCVTARPDFGMLGCNIFQWGPFDHSLGCVKLYIILRGCAAGSALVIASTICDKLITYSLLTTCIFENGAFPSKGAQLLNELQGKAQKPVNCKCLTNVQLPGTLWRRALRCLAVD